MGIKARSPSRDINGFATGLHSCLECATKRINFRGGETHFWDLLWQALDTGWILIYVIPLLLGGTAATLLPIRNKCRTMAQGEVSGTRYVGYDKVAGSAVDQN